MRKKLWVLGLSVAVAAAALVPGVASANIGWG